MNLQMKRTIVIEREEGRDGFAVPYETQRVDEDGFIRTVEAVDIPQGIDFKSKEPQYLTKTVEVSDDVKRIKIKKNGSMEYFNKE